MAPWMACAALLAACGDAEFPGAAPGAGRHLILISIDTLRPDRLGCYGHARDTSPALDRLAREGVLFEDVTSASPWTLPAHASLLTGHYASRHGVVDLTRRLDAALPTLASLLGERGYATAAVVNSSNLTERHGLERGFEQFHHVPELADDGSIPDGAAEVLAHARPMLERRGERPLFLFLHFYDVHSDYAPDEAYRARFVRPYAGTLAGSTAELLDLRQRGAPLEAADVEHLLDLYDAEIRQLDDQLGRFFEELAAAGLWEDALVAVVSDHGEEFLEHGSLLHGRTYYQEIVRIPWILRGPGIPPGRRIAAPVHLVDVAPTLIALAGVEAPEAAAMDGLALAELVRGEVAAPPERLLFAEADHNNAEPDIRRLVRTPRHKLVYDQLLERVELYDLARDPREQLDLAASESALAARLLDELEAFRSGARAGQEIGAPPAELLRDLERLGY